VSTTPNLYRNAENAGGGKPERFGSVKVFGALGAEQTSPVNRLGWTGQFPELYSSLGEKK
jgi:hypothetical protein